MITSDQAIGRILSRLNTVESRINTLATRQFPLRWNATQVAVGSSVFLGDVKFQVYDSTVLPATQGAYRDLSAATQQLDANTVQLRTRSYRTANATGSQYAALVLQRMTDATEQAFVSFYGDNIGINTVDPSITLGVGDATTGFKWLSTGSMQAYSAGAVAFAWDTATFTAYKRISVVPTSASIALFVRGDTSASGRYAAMFRNSDDTNLMYLSNNGYCYAISAWNTSDRRAKRAIQPVVDTTDIVKRLKTYRYQVTTTGHTEYGFMADELADPNGANLPELVQPASHCVHCQKFADDHDDADHAFSAALTVNNTAFIPLLTNALQRILKRVERLEQRKS